MSVASPAVVALLIVYSIVTKPPGSVGEVVRVLLNVIPVIVTESDTAMESTDSPEVIASMAELITVMTPGIAVSETDKLTEKVQLPPGDNVAPASDKVVTLDTVVPLKLEPLPQMSFCVVIVVANAVFRATVKLTPVASATALTP